MRLYHFTSRRHLSTILRDGVLLPGESNVGSPDPMDIPYGTGVGPDVVWLLDIDYLHDPHGLFADKTGKDQICIAVEVDAVHWMDWTFTAQMSPHWRAIMIAAGGGLDAAQHWYVMPAPIPASRWVSIKDMESGKFIPIPLVTTTP